uniref:Copia protein n=1 Tax=Cajanus cajan TaxID=3821 RepID=A0A151UBV8_CAJCA|nr:Copia protein [Cajanus cajan]
MSWKTKKQTTVFRYSNEVGYHAMIHATSEIVWLRNLLSSLQVTCESPTIFYCDNQVVIHLVANLVFHEKTKYIELNYQTFTTKKYYYHLCFNSRTTSRYSYKSIKYSII